MSNIQFQEPAKPEINLEKIAGEGNTPHEEETITRRFELDLMNAQIKTYYRETKEQTVLSIGLATVGLEIIYGPKIYEAVKNLF